MAESVDALVSNTSGATHPGSSPGLGTRFKKQRDALTSVNASLFFYFVLFSSKLKLAGFIS